MAASRSQESCPSAKFETRESRKDAFTRAHSLLTLASAVTSTVVCGPMVDSLVQSAGIPWAGLAVSGLAGGVLGWAVSRHQGADSDRTFTHTVAGATMGVIGGAVAGGNGFAQLANYAATATVGGSTMFLLGHGAHDWVANKTAVKLDGPAYAAWAAGKEATHTFKPGEANLVAENLPVFLSSLKNERGELDASAATKIKNLTEAFLASHANEPAKVNSLFQGIAQAAAGEALDPQSTGLTMGAVLAALASSDQRDYGTFASIGGDFLSAIPGFSQAAVLVAGMKAALKLLGSKQLGSDRVQTAGILKSEVQLAWGRALENRDLKKREFSLLTNGMDAGLAANGIL